MNNKMGNPINPAMDKLYFSTDIAEVFAMLNSGEPWVVLGAFKDDGEYKWQLGRVSRERIKSLPSFLGLYEDDAETTLGRLIADGVPVDPSL